MDDTLRALSSIDPSRLTYQEWLEIGIALKAEGYSVSTWADWSRSDPRFKEHDLDKWGGFNADTMSAGTIFHYAKLYGNYTAHRALSWDDGLKANYEEVLTAQKPVEDEQPYEMAIRYLETLYKPDEWVSYVTSAEFREDQHKWVPANGGSLRKCEDIIRDLKEGKDIEAGFGTMNAAAGAWIRHNPAKGPNDKDVTAFRHVLVESDVLDIEDQKKILIESELPISALIESGGKSIHAIVKIDAADEAEYKKRVNFLFEYMSNKGFVIDKNNKNPARLSRLPGAMRGDKRQKLIGTNLGRASWQEWLDYIEGINDDLPPIISAREFLSNPTPEPPAVIEGILKKGAKMICSGDSKSGKTCLLTNLAICIAEGWEWLGHQCMQGRVLYINLEVLQDDWEKRYLSIYKSHESPVSEAGKDNFDYWYLRGKAETLDKLAKKIIRRCRGKNYLAIIVDPIYKVQGGDENSAEAIGRFCALFDKIAEETGAALIYVHHHSKGMQGGKKAMDRMSGSGVFARDADAIVDFTNLVVKPGDREKIRAVIDPTADDITPLRLEFVLRSFRSPKPVDMFFQFPLHNIDTLGLLRDAGAAVEGTAEANRMLSPNSGKTEEEMKEIVDRCFEAAQEITGKTGDEVPFSKMYAKPHCPCDKSTLQKYIESLPDYYELDRSSDRYQVRRKS